MVAFGLGAKLPELKGGFHLQFPSIKFGAKGEVEDSFSSEDEDSTKKRGGFGLDIKAPKFGFGSGKPSAEVDVEEHMEIDEEAKAKKGFGFDIKAPKLGFGKGKEDVHVDKPSAEAPKAKVWIFFFEYLLFKFMFSMLFSSALHSLDSRHSHLSSPISNLALSFQNLSTVTYTLPT